MNSTLIPKPSDDPHDVVVVAPDAVGVAPSDEELSDLLQQAARHRSDIRTQIAPDVPAVPKGPTVDTTFRPSAVNDVLVQSEPWSVLGRVVRAFMALLLADCIGLGAVAWRAWGDTAEKKIAKWATQFALTASPAAEKPPVAQQAAPSVHQADAANAAPPQPAVAQAVAPAAAASSPGSPQLLQSMSRDLANLAQEVEQLKTSLEQLKAGQQQMSRDVAKASELKASDVKASEPSLRPRTSALPPRPLAARAHKPIAPPPPPQTAAAPALSQAPAPYVPRQIENQRQPVTERLADPELSSIPRPPMPVR